MLWLVLTTLVVSVGGGHFRSDRADDKGHDTSWWLSSVGLSARDCWDRPDCLPWCTLRDSAPG